MSDRFLTAVNIKKSALFAPFAPAREGAHNGTAWLMPEADAVRQPQDGITRSLASEVRTLHARVVSGIGVCETKLASALLSEPEDARITGGTRSLMRRALGLNIPKQPAKAQMLIPARVA
jgi:hypothetical protein